MVFFLSCFWACEDADMSNIFLALASPSGPVCWIGAGGVNPTNGLGEARGEAVGVADPEARPGGNGD